jgi:hypothetical protein
MGERWLAVATASVDIGLWVLSIPPLLGKTTEHAMGKLPGARASLKGKKMMAEKRN